MPEPSPRIATYRTTPGNVAQEVCLVVLTVPLMIGLGGLCSWLWYYLATPSAPGSDGVPQLAHRVLLACLPAGLAATLVFLWMKQRLKFTLQIGPTFLVFGRGVFREEVPCAAVESIHDRPGQLQAAKHHWIELHAKGIHWKCFLGAATPDALGDLQHVCRNAVIVDSSGNARLPQNTLEPIRTIRNLLRVRHRVAIGAFAAALFLLLWGLPLLAMIALAVLKHKFDWSHCSRPFFEGLLFTIGGAVHLWVACTSLRKAARLRRVMGSYLAPGVTEAVSRAAFDLSRLNIQDI